jgi:hypothetical protein
LFLFRKIEVDCCKSKNRRELIFLKKLTITCTKTSYDDDP